MACLKKRCVVKVEGAVDSNERVRSSTYDGSGGYEYKNED